MVEFYCINDHKVGQVVFIRSVVAVPSDNVERTMMLDGAEQVALVFVDHLKLDVFHVFEPGGRCEEIARIGQSIGA